MSTLLKLGLSGYDVKPRFGAFQCDYLLQNPLFFLGKNFGDTRHPYEKNEPTLDHLGGGVHGKACWLIAYYVECISLMTLNVYSAMFTLHSVGHSVGGDKIDGPIIKTSKCGLAVFTVCGENDILTPHLIIVQIDYNAQTKCVPRNASVEAKHYVYIWKSVSTKKYNRIIILLG